MPKRRKGGSSYDRMHILLKHRYVAFNKSKYARKRVKMINGGYKGTQDEFREVVLKYWKKYGRKPKKYWYDIYCNGQESYDPRYIPDSMWYKDILPYFNNLIMRRASVDKGMYTRIIQNVKKPETIVKNMAGRFYDGDGDHLISREEALRICASEEHLIVKPSLDSGGGRGISFYDRDKEDSPQMETLFEEFGVNFVVQRLVKQHPDLAKIHASSLNTVRVMSFFFKGEVHILSAQLRMGGGSSRVDNVSAGGCACAVKPDGWLYEKSVTRTSEWTDTHSSGIKFKDIQVPNYAGIIETVKRLHRELPYFNIIGRDFAVDEGGEPVFMEFNVMPEQNQIGSARPAFGDLTDEVLDDIFLKKSLKEIFD